MPRWYRPVNATPPQIKNQPCFRFCRAQKSQHVSVLKSALANYYWERTVAPLWGKVEQTLAQIKEHIVRAGVRPVCVPTGIAGEGEALTWEAVNWGGGIIHVRREKRGINPFVPILPEMEQLLKQMQTRMRSNLLFPSVLDTNKPLAYPTLARKSSNFCRSSEMRYVTLHGLRSFFVTQCRESGSPDTEIAAGQKRSSYYRANLRRCAA